MRYKIVFAVLLSLLLVISYCNWKYEVIAFHPFRSEGQPELTVMTWNVYCPNGADSSRQKDIVDLILEVDADFVLLNEYNQDSCMIVDSLLRLKYPYTEEYQSHKYSGDIFYSKRKMSESGHVFTPKGQKGIKTIKATISVGSDSVQVFGVHMASNHYKGSTLENEFVSDTTSYDRYIDAQESRCFQAHWTKWAVLESNLPVVVMGDMNDFNRSAPLDTLTGGGLKDSWWEGGFGYGATFHKGWMRLRIDHILHSKDLNLESIKVIETDLSDHNPVVAEFSLNTNTNRTN